MRELRIHRNSGRSDDTPGWWSCSQQQGIRSIQGSDRGCPDNEVHWEIGAKDLCMWGCVFTNQFFWASTTTCAHASRIVFSNCMKHNQDFDLIHTTTGILKNTSRRIQPEPKIIKINAVRNSHGRGGPEKWRGIGTLGDVEAARFRKLLCGITVDDRTVAVRWMGGSGMFENCEGGVHWSRHILEQHAHQPYISSRGTQPPFLIFPFWSVPVTETKAFRSKSQTNHTWKEWIYIKNKNVYNPHMLFSFFCSSHMQPPLIMIRFHHTPTCSLQYRLCNFARTYYT